MFRLPLVALLLASCAAPRGPWVVQGTVDSATASQALAIVEAAKRVAGPSSIDHGGRIVILPRLDSDFTGCHVAPGKRIAGCCACGGTQATIWVLWPHPLLPGEGFERSALAHELGHVISLDEPRSDAFGLLVVQEWRRDLP